MKQVLLKIDQKVFSLYSHIRRFLLNLKPCIKVGKGTMIESGSLLRVQGGGSISIGRECYISKGAQLLTHGGKIEIGNHCSFNPYCVIYGQGG